MKEEIIIINGEPFYRIPNGTSCDYAPIPKEFKSYFEKLEEENKSLQSQLKAKEEVIEEAINHIRDCCNMDIKWVNLHFDYAQKEMSSDEVDDLLEILSKGENK